MKIRSLIIDDEMPSREALANYITGYCPDVDILAQCDSARSACEAIMKYRPALIFLDIEMPNGNGFDLLKMVKSIDFKVIFITAFSEYAIRAFRFSATDYLLKPVKVDELVEAVNKVKQEIALEKSNANIQKLLENISLPGTRLNQLVIPDSNGFQVVDTEKLIYCEADGYCTHFYLTGKIKITSSKNLKHYEELLSGFDFLRVHNSYLINPSHVKAYTHQGEIRMTENLTCPLGSSYKRNFLERFRKLK
jgi:two-component system LytT family response regulator